MLPRSSLPGLAGRSNLSAGNTPARQNFFTPATKNPSRPFQTSTTPVGNPFTPTPSPRNTLGINTVRSNPPKAEKLAGVISKDDRHLVEVFAPFPFIVNDHLKRLPEFDSSHLNGKIDGESGYVWVIMNDISFTSQKKLFVWNFKQAASGLAKTRQTSSEVIQLTLPGSPNDGQANSDLVCIVQSPDQSFQQSMSIGVFAVSNNGQIRYWPQASESMRFIESHISLQSDREYCSYLTSYPESGFYILCTSTGRLILLTVQGAQIRQRELKKTSSLLKTFGSWLGISSANQNLESNDNNIISCKMSILPDQGAHLWILTTSKIQVWYFHPKSPETLVLDFDFLSQYSEWTDNEYQKHYGASLPMEYFVNDLAVRIHSNKENGSVSVLIGVRPSLSGLEQFDGNQDARNALEFAATSPPVFHIVTFTVSGGFTELSHFARYNQSITLTMLGDQTLAPEVGVLSENEQAEEDQMLGNPLMNIPAGGAACYIHWDAKVMCTCLPWDQRSVDIVDLVNATDDQSIFGYGSTEKSALYLIPRFGIVRIQQFNLPSWEATIAMEESQYSPQSRSQGIPHSDNGMNEEGFDDLMPNSSHEDKIREAFARYLSSLQNQDIAQTYPWKPIAQLLIATDCENAVESFSKELLDRRPAEDPRWPELASNTDIPASFHRSQALLHQQIEEKIETHLNFVDFLNESGILSRLPLKTIAKLLEDGEKLAAARSLRAKQNDLQQTQLKLGINSTNGTKSSVILQAMKDALFNRGITQKDWVREGLGPQDVYFAQISCLESILEPTFSTVQASLNSKLSLESQFFTIVEASSVFEALFVASMEYRKQQEVLYYGKPLSELIDTSSQDGGSQSEKSILNYQVTQPWTRSSHARTLLRSHIRLHCQFLTQVLKERKTNERKSYTSSISSIDTNLLYNQLYSLSECLLYDCQMELEHYRGNQSNLEDLKDKFGTLRKELIDPFTQDSLHYEQALSLSEKFLEFKTLIEVCEATNSRGRLLGYVDQFSQHDFSRFLFEWYFVNKKFYKLLASPNALWKELLNYLNNASERRELAWVHQIRCDEFETASETLQELAQLESTSTLRQTTLLSLSKLASLAGLPDDTRLETIDVFALNPEREQMLTLRAAQSTVESIQEYDQAQPPLSTEQIVDQLFDLFEGNEHLQPGASMGLALELFRNTSLLRTLEQNQQLLHKIWHKIISVEQWAQLASAYSSSQIDDFTLQENIENSLFYGLALQSPNLIQELAPKLYADIVSSPDLKFRPSTQRILAIAYNLVFSARNERTPTLPPFTSYAQLEDSEIDSDGPILVPARYPQIAESGSQTSESVQVIDLDESEDVSQSEQQDEQESSNHILDDEGDDSDSNMLGSSLVGDEQMEVTNTDESEDQQESYEEYEESSVSRDEATQSVSKESTNGGANHDEKSEEYTNSHHETADQVTDAQENEAEQNNEEAWLSDDDFPPTPSEVSESEL